MFSNSNLGLIFRRPVYLLVNFVLDNGQSRILPRASIILTRSEGHGSHPGYIYIFFETVLSLSNAIFFISVFAEQDN